MNRVIFPEKSKFKRLRCGGVLLALTIALLFQGALAGSPAVAEANPGPQLNFHFPAGYTPAYSRSATAALTYASYIGGNGADEGKGVAVDGQGNIYLIGETESDDFLGVGHAPAGYSDIFVAKFNPSGTNLLYLTFIGSPDTDTPLSIRVDAQGNAYATALIYDDNFPTKNGLWPSPPAYWANGVLFKLDGGGGLAYSTYLPFDLFDARHNLAVDGAGQAYVTGTSYPSSDNGPYLGSQIGLLQFNAAGSQLLLEKHLGGPAVEKGTAVVVDSAGRIYLTGTTGDGDSFPVTVNAHQPMCGDLLYDPTTYCYQDGVIIALDAAGQVIYSSYLGGSFTDQPQALATDGQGRVLVAGNTASGQFPLVNALQASCPLNSSTGDCLSPRGFVSLLDLSQGRGSLVYSTYLGSPETNSTTVVLAAAMDSTGHAFVSGYTNGHQFPLAAPVQGSLAESFCTTLGSQRSCFDAFVTQFTPSGGLAFSTYLGATFDEFAYDLAVTGTGSIYLTGLTEADDFPVSGSAFQAANPLGQDAFLVRLGGGGGSGGQQPVGNNKLFLPFVTR